MKAIIREQDASALGDVRLADVVYIVDGARKRQDWGRYVEAVAAAVSHGADVRWVTGG